MGIRLLRQDDLPPDGFARELAGERFGVGACLIFVDAEPAEGPKLHRHPYAEILLILEGVATLDDGVATRELTAGDIAIIEAGQPHAFVNSGDEHLRQIDIHLSPRFVTEWLA